MLLAALIAIALGFDFMNGRNDAANSIATVVSTRVLSPRYAVIWAAFFNFVAFLFFGLHVATTIGKGIIDPAVVDPAVVFAALTGAIAWDLITWFYGIPSSSSHALIGGYAGAGVAKAGWGAITWGDRKSTRLNSSHVSISYAVFCLKKKKRRQLEARLVQIMYIHE